MIPLGSEKGLSLIELSIVSALLLVVLAMLATVLNSANRTTNVVTQESRALDEARVAVGRIERELRSALDFSMCNATASDNCILLFTQLGDASTRLVKYQVAALSGTKGSLTRATCTTSTACDPPELKLNNLLVNAGTTAFTCLTDAQIVRVRVSLTMTPLSTTSQGGALSFSSTARPRNLARSTC